MSARLPSAVRMMHSGLISTNDASHSHQAWYTPSSSREPWLIKSPSRPKAAAIFRP